MPPGGAIAGGEQGLLRGRGRAHSGRRRRIRLRKVDAGAHGDADREADLGFLTLDGVDAVSPPASEQRRLRRTVQFVFQNPYGSLNPRKKIGTILEEPLLINTDLSKAERTEKARAMMEIGRAHV